MDSNEITINGETFIRKVVTPDGGKVLIRSVNSGVHFGRIESRDGGEVTLSDARRIWYWSGAASLSQMAVDGVSNPKGCKFTVRVPLITVFGVCEIIPCTAKAIAIIDGVPEWKR